jgi:hypothetical protein
MRDCALDTGCRGAVSECIPAETAATAIRHRVAAVRSTRAAALGKEDKIVEVTSIGERDVYRVSAVNTHNVVAQGISVRMSLEQSPSL